MTILNLKHQTIRNLNIHIILLENNTKKPT